MQSTLVKNRNLESNIFKIVFIGDAGVGKTNICNRIMGLPFEPLYIPTIGLDFQEATFNYSNLTNNQIPSGNMKLRYNFWELGGQKDFIMGRTIFTKNIDIGIIVYDLRNIKESKLEELYFQIISQNDSPPKMILIGNKIDLIEDFNDENFISGRNIISEFCDKYDTINYEISAKNLYQFEYVQDILIESLIS